MLGMYFFIIASCKPLNFFKPSGISIIFKVVNKLCSKILKHVKTDNLAKFGAEMQYDLWLTKLILILQKERQYVCSPQQFICIG